MFYHFTSVHHLPIILDSPGLRPVESNVGAPFKGLLERPWAPVGAHQGPDVVWLLDTPTVDHNHGLSGYADKTAVRITVDVPAIRWVDWEHTARMDPAWRRSLLGPAGGEEAAKHWYVFPAPIRKARFVEIALRQPDGTYKATHEKRNGYLSHA